MRILVAMLLAALLGAGCGGSKKQTFANANFVTLIEHPAKYNGAHVDFKGEVGQVSVDDSGIPWLLVYADAAHASQITLVEAPTASGISAPALVHVTGTVDQGLTVPFDLSSYEPAPIVKAETVATR